jgi:hypothetical protein
VQNGTYLEQQYGMLERSRDLVKRGLFAHLIFSCGLTEIYVPFVDPAEAANDDQTDARWARLNETSFCGGPSIERAQCGPATWPEQGQSERKELHLRPRFHKSFCHTIAASSMGASGCRNLVLFGPAF